MNKSDLVRAVSSVGGMGRAEAEHAVDAVIATVMTEIKAGRKVALMGFGTFVPTSRPARMGRNPRTGEAVPVPASSGVRFAAGSLFKSVLNKGGAIPVPVVKKAAAKKATAKKAAKRGTKKVAAKRAPAKKAVKRTVKKATAKRAPAKKAVKRTAKKATAKRAPAKKAPAKRAVKRTVKKAVKRTAKRR